MNLNIEVQLCGLFFDLILIYFIVRHETVGLYSERIFKRCIVIYTGCIVLDILSVLGIVYRASLPPFVTLSLCKAYLISLVFSSYFAFVYSYSDVLHLRENEFFKKGVFALFISAAIIIVLAPVEYYHAGRVVYSHGASVVAAFVFSPIFLLSALICTIVYAKSMNPHRIKAVRTWMIIELFAAEIQFVFPHMLLVGFGSSLGLFILYAELENPEVYLDRNIGCFTLDTFNMYISQEYADIKKFSSIIVCNKEEWKLGEEQEKAILLEMAGYLNSFGGSKLFRLSRNDFVLIYDKNEQEMNEIESAVNLDVIRQRFDQGWGKAGNLNTRFLYIPDSKAAGSLDEYVAIYMRYRDSFKGEEKLKTLDESAGESIREFNNMTKEIRDALQNDRIEVFFQPIYSIETGKFVSAEALARMRGEDGKLIMPGKFIPVAEESGLIAEIGERVFEKTCRFIKDRKLYDMGIEYVEVNLSVAQCENPKLSDIYKEIMERTGLDPRYINLEITESSTLIQRSVLLDNMKKLIEAGCNFSLDDFGTGESNLNYIVDMPVKIVKFDRKMVQDYFNLERAQVVMTATVGMIKELGLKIVAEGVETEEQVEGIKALGIDYIQGFYFSKPISGNDFVEFIEKNNNGRD